MKLNVMKLRNSQHWWNWDNIKKNDKIGFSKPIDLDEKYQTTTTWILKQTLSKKHNNNHMDEVFTNANETHKLLEEPKNLQKGFK
jgi:hypothetical protein